MKLHSDASERGHACESVSHIAQDMAEKHGSFNLNHRLTLTSCAFKPDPESDLGGSGCPDVSERLCNGLCDRSGLENFTEVSEDDSRSLPSSTVDEEDGPTPEIQQAFRIFQSFLSEKHKTITAPFWRPISPGSDENPDSQMCFRKIDDKFVKREYESITTFVADFRLMLENCYRFHGVDHWISRQAQKLEVILEQKLSLLSRSLREKTTLAVTSRGRFGTEDEKGSAGTSSRRRSVPRNLAAITVGGSESIMVQALRLEELQRAKEERRQRELERKEAEEVSAKEVEEWEQLLLSLAEPFPIGTMWELPAIGHFLCLAQTALNLPEIVFFELERCLLMPRCSSFLAKVMTSLLCPSPKRATLHRRPALPYRKWEVELRRRVQGWYQAVGRVEDQVSRAEQLGLCNQFFRTLGEVNPLEETPFHLLPFNQRVWLLKGLCDHVYETQKDVQDAVLGQPIHECRESILGYDGQENAYIHFPHFCGADLRIYCQSPSLALEFPLPAFCVKRFEQEECSEGSEGSEVRVPSGEERMSGDGVKVEKEDSDKMDPDTWGVNEESLQDRKELDLKCPLSLLRCEDESLDHESVRKEHSVKEEGSDREPCFRVGTTCYRGKSPANSHTNKSPETHTTTTETRSPCPECSAAPQETSQRCTNCHLWTDPVRPETSPPPRDDNTQWEAETICCKKNKRKKKKERKLSLRKSNTGKLSLKNRTTKSTLHRAATSVKKRDRRKKLKLSKKLDGRSVLVKKKEGSSLLPAEPTFQLVCSSLEDLRVLINKTEDELDELDSNKQRSGRWFQKRSAVKELHITLIRLLNELLPWEPKLVKAFQRNRARLKKESDDFKKHPEYENFVREQMDSAHTGENVFKDGLLSAETTRESEDEVKIERTIKGDSETAENMNQIRSNESRCLDDRPEVITAFNESGPSTRSSKRRQSSGINDELSPCKRVKLDPESSSTSELNVEVSSRKQQTVTADSHVSERVSMLSEPVTRFQGNYKPIQALLAKSVGNKVTLISHSQAAVMAQTLQEQNKTASATAPPVRPLTTCQPTPRSEPSSTLTPTPTTTQSTGQVVYKTAGGLGLLRKGGTSVKFSVQPLSDQQSGEKVMQQVVILPSNLLIQSTEKKASQQPRKANSVSVSKTTTYLSNASGFTVPENKVPVQQVAPLKDTSDVRTPSAAVLPNLRTLTTTGRGSTVPKKTTEPKAVLNRPSTQTSISPTKSDAKQELKTVCIRDSQSILVTTRGGNTGVVKVQTSEQSLTGALPPSPVFTIPPQLHAFLVSKSTTNPTSTTQAASANITARSLPGITPLINRGSPQSLSKDIIPVSSSALVAGTLTSSTLKRTGSDSLAFTAGSLTKTLITGESSLPATGRSSDGVLFTVKDAQGIQQNTVSKCIIKSPQKRTVAGNKAPDQSTFQKVFLVTPSTNIPPVTSKVATTSAACTMPGSRVMFMSHPSASDNSALTTPSASTLEANISSAVTTPALEAMKVVPKLGTTFGCTAPGVVPNIQSFSVPGLKTRILSTNKNTPPVTDVPTKPTPVIVSRVIAASNSSGQQIGQKSNCVESCSPSGNGESLKVTRSVDGKTLTFSTLGTGHMASSALLSVVKQDVPSSASTAVSVLNALNSKPGLTVGSSTSNIGSLISKHTTLPIDVKANKPQMNISLCTSPKPLKTTGVTSPVQASLPCTLISTIQTPTPPVLMTSGVRPSTSATKSVQEKIVINTTTPLSPGTQLLINNTRFVVPAQGLGPGSHVLLISNSACPGGLQGAGPSPTVLRGLNDSPPCPVASVVQGMKLVTPQQTLVRLPSPTTANIGQSDSVRQQVSTIRTALTATGAAAPSPVAQPLHAGVSSGQPSLSNIVRLPMFQTSDGKGLIVTPSQVLTSCSKETSVVCSLSQRGLLSTTSPMLMQTRLANTPPQNQAASVVPPVKTVISRNLPMVTIPPMSSTISRMQKLPVATVPPIGGPNSSSQATPIATVPPSMNTVIMTPCQPVRAVQAGTPGKPVILPQPQQIQNKTPVQVSTTSIPSKLLLSPDGAILNIVQSPASSSLQTTANPMTAQMFVPATSSITAPPLNTNDPLIKSVPDIQGGLNH